MVPEIDMSKMETYAWMATNYTHAPHEELSQ